MAREIPTQEQIEKLPKWAQDYVRLLQMHVEERDRLLWKAQDTILLGEEAKLDAVPFPVYEWGMKHLEGVAGPQTFIRDLKVRNPHFNLGMAQRLSHDGRKYPHKKVIDVQIRDGQLHVNASGTLVVRHNSSNTCSLDVE